MDSFQAIFGSATSGIEWWQMCARAIVIVVYALVLLRISARRILGNGTAVDVIVAVIVGSALSRAMTGTVPLLPTLSATAVLVALHSMVAFFAVRSDWFSSITKGRSTQLVESGHVDWRRAKRALIGAGDIAEELRLHGLKDLDAVESAYLERNGRISIVPRSGGD